MLSVYQALADKAGLNGQIVKITGELCYGREECILVESGFIGVPSNENSIWIVDNGEVRKRLGTLAKSYQQDLIRIYAEIEGLFKFSKNGCGHMNYYDCEIRALKNIKFPHPVFLSKRKLINPYPTGRNSKGDNHEQRNCSKTHN